MVSQEHAFIEQVLKFVEFVQADLMFSWLTVVGTGAGMELLVNLQVQPSVYSVL